MSSRVLPILALLACSMLCGLQSRGNAREPVGAVAPTVAEETPDPLSDDELEVLVARIALYPDELIALISEASLYPLQIVEASRFLDKLAKDKGVKPKQDWDGSVISLLNYPDLVRMMSDDLDWTQTFGDALTYQQKDVLIAIQALRDKALAAGAIKSDDKIKVSQQNDNVVIQSASSEVIYVPQYEPQMLYVPDYQIAPVSYYPDPYPSYWYPTATFFAGAVTGAIWGAAMDWDNWGVWGGRWDGSGIDIDCNKCFNNINGKVNINDVDWRYVDRSKIKVDRDQFKKLERDGMRDRVKADGRNDFRSKAAEVRRNRPDALPGKVGGKVPDVRKSKVEAGLKANGRAGGVKRDIKKPGGGAPKVDRPKATRPDSGKAGGRIDRPVGKPRPAARVDNRPKNVSALGQPKAGKREAIASKRGGQSMGGGARGGKPHVGSGGAQRTGGGARKPRPGGGGGHRTGGGRGRR